MNTGPAVVVNKGGALASLIKGVFSTVIVLVLCATVLGLYGLRVADKLVGTTALETLQSIPELVRSLPDWRQLPPLLTDALNDRRALDYAGHLEVATRYRAVDQNARGGRGLVEVVVTNTGTEVVSLATLRLLVEDDSAEAFDRLYAVATPAGCAELDWRGPLPPGGTRRLLQGIVSVAGEPRITVEWSDVRVWNGPMKLPEPPSES